METDNSLGNQIWEKWNNMLEEAKESEYGQPTLQMIADVIEEWKELFAQFYENLNKNNSKEYANGIGEASRILSNNHYLGKAIQLLIEGWQKAGEKQSSVKIHRASIAFFLCESYLHKSDIGAAYWWQLHSLADAYLEGEEEGGGAKILLDLVLGVPDTRIYEDLKEIAQNHRSICEEDEWNRKEGFAEDVVLELATEHPKYATLFAQPTNETEFPISPGYFDLLLKDIDDDKHGKKLEYLTSYLFLHIPGCTPAKNLLDEKKAMETDLVIRNLTLQSNLVAETFGRHFAIECKNWTNRVGSSQVGYFLHRLSLMHFSFGIMLTQNGITGLNKDNLYDEQAAKEMIRRTYHENGITCIVLDRNHLNEIRNGQTLRAILFEEIERFRFGVSRNN